MSDDPGNIKNDLKRRIQTAITALNQRLEELSLTLQFNIESSDIYKGHDWAIVDAEGRTWGLIKLNSEEKKLLFQCHVIGNRQNNLF